MFELWGDTNTYIYMFYYILTHKYIYIDIHSTWGVMPELCVVMRRLELPFLRT